ncbi:MAG: two-component response regulator [Gemmatimonadetes bacterium]|nr:two-component response regulator [Gemmatimonadota bacterium]
MSVSTFESQPATMRTYPETLPAKLRVLVVDDNDSVATAIAALLATRGYDTVKASSGDVALAHLRDEYFDVLLCDVKMPRMSGLEVLSESLRIDVDLPVLMLTGMGDANNGREALKRGAMDYLSKPIELDELDQAVGSAARDRRTRIDEQRSAELSTKELELVDGPLNGRKVHLHGRSLRLWVALQPDGEHVWGASDPATGVPAGARLLGSYGLAPDESALNWTAKPD